MTTVHASVHCLFKHMMSKRIFEFRASFDTSAWGGVSRSSRSGGAAERRERAAFEPHALVGILRGVYAAIDPHGEWVQSYDQSLTRKSLFEDTSTLNHQIEHAASNGNLENTTEYLQQGVQWRILPSPTFRLGKRITRKQERFQIAFLTWCFLSERGSGRTDVQQNNITDHSFHECDFFRQDFVNKLSVLVLPSPK